MSFTHVYGSILMRKAKWVLLLALPLLISCASSKRQRRPYLIDENLDNAARHLQAGEEEEAAQIYRVVLFADPTNTQARQELQALGGCERCIIEPSLLGQNLTKYPDRDSSTLWLVCYPVNRILDVLDIVTLQFGPQGGIYADAHATYAVRAAAGAGGGAEIGWSQKRELAAGSGHVCGLALGPFSAEGSGMTRVGTCGARNVSHSEAGLNRPSGFAYQRHRDYWSVGMRAIILIVGAHVEIHPVEAADAVTGVFFVDFLRDDIGSTQGLELTAADIEAMEALLCTLTPEERRARMRGRHVAPAEKPDLDRNTGGVTSTESESAPE